MQYLARGIPGEGKGIYDLLSLLTSTFFLSIINNFGNSKSSSRSLLDFCRLLACLPSQYLYIYLSYVLYTPTYLIHKLTSSIHPHFLLSGLGLLLLYHLYHQQLRRRQKRQQHQRAAALLPSCLPAFTNLLYIHLLSATISPLLSITDILRPFSSREDKEGKGVENEEVQSEQAYVVAQHSHAGRLLACLYDTLTTYIRAFHQELFLFSLPNGTTVVPHSFFPPLLQKKGGRARGRTRRE